MALRKNQDFLSAKEKKDFTDALIALKAGGRAGNRYDQFVSMHVNNVYAGHFGPAFFAWHREFLIKFEQALQDIKNDQSIALPYWDWSSDQRLPRWAPFTADFLGGNGKQGADWQVVDGPFAYSTGQWPLNVRTDGERYPYLRRQFGPSQNPTLSLPVWNDVIAALQATPYDAKPWDATPHSGFRNRAEGNANPVQMHNLVHMWVGGSMTSMTSPNDPVFWLHHCFMDKMWTDWQKMHQDQAKYLPDGGDPNDPTKRQKLNDPMAPWNTPNETVTPANVLTTTDHGYHYDTDGMLLAGEVLYPNQSIYSASRHAMTGKPNYLLTYDNTGVLQLEKAGAQGAIWGSDNHPNENIGKATLESQGNLVIYGPDNKTVVWQSDSYVDDSPCYLVVRPDGYVSIFPRSGTKPIWTRPITKT
jgi:tyrosinase